MLSCIILGCNSSDNRHELLFEEKFEFYPNMLTDASRSDTEDPAVGRLNDIMAKYDSKKYDDALNGLNDYLTENPDYFKAKFYRGLIYLKNKDLDNAIRDFEEVIQSNSTFKEEAEWYLSLSYIRAKKKDAAVSLLSQMKQSSLTQAAKAEDLLKNVNQWPN